MLHWFSLFSCFCFVRFLGGFLFLPILCNSFSSFNLLGKKIYRSSLLPRKYIVSKHIFKIVALLIFRKNYFRQLVGDLGGEWGEEVLSIPHLWYCREENRNSKSCNPKTLPYYSYEHFEVSGIPIMMEDFFFFFDKNDGGF